MRSLERRFNNLQEKNSRWSSYICFAGAVKGQRFNRQAIHRWFSKLVDKDDYARSDKKEILRFLEDLSNNPEDDKKLGKSRPRTGDF